MKLPFAENYKIKMIESIRPSTRAERTVWLKEAKYNLFNLKSEQVYVDLLTDSGTGAMSDQQWAAMMTGDESYAGSSSYARLKSAISDMFGFDHFLPTHQGRAAENVLFSVLVKEGDIVPGNSHFDTTKGHIEFRKARAIDCTVDSAFDTRIKADFKGNIDLSKLEDVFEKYPVDRIPFIVLTLTNNTVGGQPVSMKNIKDVARIARKFEVPLIFDSARFAENAYFIKMREPGYQEKSIREITREMFQYADAMTMSSKKDGYVNMGGFMAMRSRDLYDKATVYNIMFEGFVTYGGMSGRDMNALAVGLEEGLQYETLNTRIRQVAFLGKRLKEFGIPIQEPVGGHAIFIDASRFLPRVPQSEYLAQTLAIELYLESGVRGVEVGTIMADRDPQTGRNRYPKTEFVRLALPRRTYTNNHLEYVAVALHNIFERRSQIKHGYNIVREAPILRHFTVELEPVMHNYMEDPEFFKGMDAKGGTIEKQEKII